MLLEVLIQFLDLLDQLVLHRLKLLDVLVLSLLAKTVVLVLHLLELSVFFLFDRQDHFAELAGFHVVVALDVLTFTVILEFNHLNVVFKFLMKTTQAGILKVD
jgi:hypothetical protein